MVFPTHLVGHFLLFKVEVNNMISLNSLPALTPPHTNLSIYTLSFAYHLPNPVGWFSALIFLDFFAAFDTSDHSLFLEILLPWLLWHNSLSDLHITFPGFPFLMSHEWTWKVWRFRGLVTLGPILRASHLSDLSEMQISSHLTPFKPLVVPCHPHCLQQPIQLHPSPLLLYLLGKSLGLKCL